MLSLVHGSWDFMPVIDFGYLCFILLWWTEFYHIYMCTFCTVFIDILPMVVHMQCYLHTSPLLRTIVISHSLYLFSVKLIFEFLLMLDLFLSYPCVLSLYIAYGVTHVCRVMCTPPSYYAQLPPLIELSS